MHESLEPLGSLTSDEICEAGESHELLDGLDGPDPAELRLDEGVDDPPLDELRPDGLDGPLELDGLFELEELPQLPEEEEYKEYSDELLELLRLDEELELDDDDTELERELADDDDVSDRPDPEEADDDDREDELLRLDERLLELDDEVQHPQAGMV